MELDLIRNWARTYGNTSLDQVLGHGFLQWFVPWSGSFKNSKEFILLVAAGTALIGGLANKTMHSLRGPPELPEVAGVLCGGIGLAIWFLTAPSLRFGVSFSGSFLQRL